MDALRNLNDYNLITLGDLSTNSDVEFKTLVCGKLVSTSSANFGIHASQLNIKSTAAVLEIAQSLVGGSSLNVQTGSVSLGQSSDVITKNGNVQYVVNGNRPFNMNGGNNGASITFDPKLVGKCQHVSEELKELSTYMSKQSANNVVSIPSGSPGPVKFNVVSKDSNGFAFFKIADGNSLFHNSNVQQIEINNDQAKATIIVINIGGKSVNFDQANFVGKITESDLRSRVVCNFYEAQTITMQRNFMGALLAPLAHVQTNANIDGAAAVKSLTTTSELHKPQFVVPQCSTSTTRPETSKLF